MKEMVGGCCVCSDERGWPDNPLVYCDGNGCTVAVHQACYGIVTVPTGPWYCRKCECPEIKGKVRCELCPSKSGALKRSDTGGWAHVVCALYIPEVRFGNVTSMEPIVLRLIPQERYNKTCYICQDLGKSNRANAGACMQCNKSGCKQQFHVTCAQSLGLLCEEAGNYLDNVKYCGYCQHHYSKLKKGGNVKTIPPYKPVTHDSHSSDSSGEKDGDASPMASGRGTPTHATKAKGPGKKTSHSSNAVSGKSTPNASKTPTNIQSTATEIGNPETPEVSTVSRKHKSSDKSGKLHSNEKAKKPSPSRRGSSTNDVPPTLGSGGSKNNTPAPSPQHTVDLTQGSSTKVGGGSTPGSSSKSTPPSASPGGGKGGQDSSPSVISSVVTANASATNTMTASPVLSTSTSTSVVQMATTAKPGVSYQESVITNTEAIDTTKQTKKRKAVNAANNAASMDIGPIPLPIPVPNEVNPAWENTKHVPADVPMENVEKVIKKAKIEATENAPMVAHFKNPTPPPPLAHSPASHPSPRHHQNAMPGPSGVTNLSNIPLPLAPQGGKSGGEREAPTSLLVSVPLPSTSQGLNLSAHAQVPVSTHDLPPPTGPPPHMYHQLQKQAAMEQNLSNHTMHPMTGRPTWGGLNVSYEMQQSDMSKPSAIGMVNKDTMTARNMPTNTPIRNKKRAAMNASLAAMAQQQSAPLLPPPPQPQSLASVRRSHQPTPPPLYQDTIKESSPPSPGRPRVLKAKMETKVGPSCTAPHMLGNELNPDSGVAARLQEQLTAEMAAHAAGGGSMPSPLIPPPLLNKATQGSGGSGSRSTTSSAQSLDQLLERQWEQGSQFLMEQAQHFDIASLLSCLHQLRTENVRLEDHVGSLLQRRDHLLAVNARLAIPLTAPAHVGPPEPTRGPRDNGSQPRYITNMGPPGPVRSETMTSMTADRSHPIMDPTYVQLMMREVQQKPS